MTTLCAVWFVNTPNPIGQPKPTQPAAQQEESGELVHLRQAESPVRLGVSKLHLIG